MSDTFVTATTVVPETTCTGTMTVQYLLEKASDGVPAGRCDISPNNRLKVFICGEEAFAQIARDIQSAKTSIDIAAWGFDPAMNLIRGDGQWRQENSFGELLRQAAKRGVKVRLLVWYNPVGSSYPIQNNMPGYGLGTGTKVSEVQARSSMGGMAPPPLMGANPFERSDYGIDWYRDYKTYGIELTTRDGNAAAIKDALGSETQKPSAQMDKIFQSELGLLVSHGTHHQKTILIDYQAPKSGVGYVMGLNSLTDYWDSAEHQIDDERRERATGAEHRAGWKHKKPYQDYACRIDGGNTLQDVHHNFTRAWQRADGANAVDLSPVGQVVLAPGATPAEKADSKPATSGKAPSVRAQILRTQPEEDEKSIKAFYAHTASVAEDYLYIENQYFYYPEWANTLKTKRKDWVKAWKDKYDQTCNPNTKNLSLEDIPILHTMVVIPEPERAEMVPRTYEMMKTLGREEQMIDDKRDAQGKPVMKDGQAVKVGQGALDNQHAEQMAQYERDLKTYRQAVQQAKQSGDYSQVKVANLPIKPKTTEEVIQDMAAIPTTSDAQLEKDLRLKVHVAMLYTSGVVAGKTRYRDIYIHSKLMIHGDNAFTLGSANINQRSMSADSEINIASDDPVLTADLRKRVFGLHSGGRVSGGQGQYEAVAAFNKWTDVSAKNSDKKDNGEMLQGFLLPFKELRESLVRYA